MATYPILTLEQFGDQLLKTGDLDPVYIAIHNAGLRGETLARLLVAYVCFYHLGAAAKLAEAKSHAAFWTGMAVAAENLGDPKPWPRGAERRHFRGAQATLAVKELIQKYRSGTDAWQGFIGKPSYTFQSVRRAAQSHRGFGDWISFKIADIAERVWGADVDFSDCHLGIYKDPRQGAALAWVQEENYQLNVGEKPWEYPLGDEALKYTVDRLVARWRKKKAKAPPAKDRLVNVQEIETILCKYKSHVKGHYPLMKDSDELNHGLAAWARKSDVAYALHEGLTRGL